ncbi:hypothetical protein HOC37_00175 [bacterium]|mgnify:FL=1|nr:hypothetical protein [bacterium]MBT4551382.1 hypothetical protein [bacterium]MBT5988792.1 hypothetical protein [bacterium]MBT7087373.1 hypothetical protein [bacterium]
MQRKVLACKEEDYPVISHDEDSDKVALSGLIYWLVTLGTEESKNMLLSTIRTAEGWKRKVMEDALFNTLNLSAEGNLEFKLKEDFIIAVIQELNRT